VKEKKEGVLEDIVIYNRTDKANEQFFSSQTGHMKRKNNISSLLLNDGYGYTYSKDKLQQAQYKTLEVYDNVHKQNFKFVALLSHWKKALTEEKMMHRALFFIFVSLIPLLSVSLVAAFTMINPRYQSNNAFIVIFTTTLLLYMIASSLEKWGNLWILLLSILAVVSLGKWLFSKRVSRYF